MSRKQMKTPISILLASVLIIVLLLVGSGPRTSAIERAETGYPTMTPCQSSGNQTDYNNCLLMQPMYLTQTALADPAYPYTATTGPTATSGSSSSSAVQTSTPTATTSPTTTAQPAGLSATETPVVITAVNTVDQAPPTQTPTATPASQLACIPGVPIEITGNGPPHAAYLLYFGQRAVGGGSVEQDGSFRAKLIVGQERPGNYDVTVRVRGTQQVLRQLTCGVPEVTPTPLPAPGFTGLR